SAVFSKAGRISRFLRYAVEESLGGRASRISEYSIGVEVYERPATFDARLDSIVRVEAGRLRSKLREYYETGEEGTRPDRLSEGRLHTGVQGGRSCQRHGAAGERAESAEPTRPCRPSLRRFEPAAGSRVSGGWNRGRAHVRALETSRSQGGVADLDLRLQREAARYSRDRQDARGRRRRRGERAEVRAPAPDFGADDRRVDGVSDLVERLRS